MTHRTDSPNIQNDPFMENPKQSLRTIDLQPLFEFMESMNRPMTPDVCTCGHEDQVPGTNEESCFNDVCAKLYGNGDDLPEADEESDPDDAIAEFDSEEVFPIKGFDRQDQFSQPHLHSKIVKCRSSKRCIARRRADRWHKSNVYLQLQRAFSSYERFEKGELLYAIKMHKFGARRRAKTDKSMKNYSFRPTGNPGEWEVVYL
jgi:hypothetical protein